MGVSLVITVFLLGSVRVSLLRERLLALAGCCKHDCLILQKSALLGLHRVDLNLRDG